MCLHPVRILNPAYQISLKNPTNRRKPIDERLKYINAPCGHCPECRRRKVMDIRIRCQEHNTYMIQRNYIGYFVTLTFTEKSFENLSYSSHSTDALVIATYAIRKFRDRWRKSNLGELHYILIPELGHQFTERLHFHGFIWQRKENIEPYKDRYCIPGRSNSTITNLWRYGNVYFGNSVNNRAINYITKYMLKQDNDHPGFNPSPFISRFFGKSFIYNHNYNINNPVTTYRLDNGKLTSLPKYYMHHFYDTYDREKLQLRLITDDYQFIHGVKLYKPSLEEIEKLTQDAINRFQQLTYKHNYDRYPASMTIRELILNDNYTEAINRLLQPLYVKKNNLKKVHEMLDSKALRFYYKSYIEDIDDLIIFIKYHRNNLLEHLEDIQNRKQQLSKYYNNKFKIYYMYENERRKK